MAILHFPVSHLIGLFGTLLLLAGVQVQAATLESTWLNGNYRPVGKFDNGWLKARSAIRMDRGWIFARNDGKTLYLMFDMIGDTHRDLPKSSSPWGDFISLTFDVDRNRKINANRDVQYAMRSGTYRLMARKADAQGRFSRRVASVATLSSGFRSSANQKTAHRIWEFAIPLRELSVSPGGSLRFGVSVHSRQPAFSDSLPAGYLRKVGAFGQIRLAGDPAKLRIAHIARLTRFDLKRVVIKPDFSSAPAIARPDGVVSRPTPRTCPPATGNPVKRAILGDGRIELTFANGTRKRQADKAWEVVCPDGTVIHALTVQKSMVHETMDPTLPSGDTSTALLASHEQDLLNIIGTLVDDSTMVLNYLNSEDATWDIYQRIDARGRTISFLLAE